MMLMKIVKLKEVKILPNVHEVDARKLYDTEKDQIIHITLKSGERLKKHVPPIDVVFHILVRERNRRNWRRRTRSRTRYTY